VIRSALQRFSLREIDSFVPKTVGYRWQGLVSAFRREAAGAGSSSKVGWPIRKPAAQPGSSNR
jgi:hypothetical protein